MRAASLDADSCRRQLEAMERSILSVGSPSLDVRVRGGDHDRMARDVARMVDREAELQKRIDSDYDLIDAACSVLYGSDGTSDGLAALCPPWWCDAIYYHWVQCRTWAEVGALVSYSPSHCRRAATAAFDLADANGMAATVAGVGRAEG